MDKRLTVAYLVRPAEGGIKTHIITLLRHLDAKRFKAVVICPPDSAIYADVAEAGYPTIPCEIPGDIDPVMDLRAVVHLRGILRELRPDIVHMHSMKAGLIGRAAAATLRRRPHLVLTFHSFVFDERVGPKKRAVTRSVERILGRFTDRFTAVSHALRDQIVAELGVSGEKVTVVYNGLDFPEIPRRSNQTPVVGTVARLAPQKGVEHFVRAAARVRQLYPSVQFRVVGDGPLRAELEELTRSLGLTDRLEFMGFREDASAILAGFDVFVLASTWETFGITVAEALSLGVPVVASRVGGIPEIVDGVTTGLLAEPGDHESIARQVCRLLADDALASALGTKGREFVRSHFTAERVVAETERIYLEAISGR